MLLYIVLLFVVSFLCYVFFAPFYLEINTNEKLYRLRFHKVASLCLGLKSGSLIAEIKVAGWSKKMNLFEEKDVLKGKPVEKKHRIKQKKRRIPWKKIRGTVMSFKVHKCLISIDSGNMQLNGLLYPIFYLTALYSRKNVQINFMGVNEIILEVENSLARMGWAYLRS